MPRGLPTQDPASTPAQTRYLTEQLITYLGNKRSLLGFIGSGLALVKRRLGRAPSIADLFSGSGVVARFFKLHARELIVNDLEAYAEVINRCYLSDPDRDLRGRITQAHGRVVRRLAEEPLEAGLIAELYAPRNDQAIAPGERVFFTRRNAMYLDTARRRIAELPEELQPYLLGPLLSEASVHANTAGVFKGFYKDRSTGIGRFGGTGADALSRITGPIDLPEPIFSPRSCDVDIRREDANLLARSLREIDIAYLDPPYNQHPYGSNYFMLNLLVDYRRPEQISRISGIPANWNRSLYNKARHALDSLEDLVRNLPSRFLLVSFNSEGFVDRHNLEALLAAVGPTSVLETGYNAFRGSRNLRGRSLHVREYLFVTERR